MEKIKTGLLALIAVLMILQIIDRSRETEQMEAVYKQVEKTQVSLDQLAKSQNAIMRKLEEGVVATASGASTGTMREVVGDGKPCLDKNFLLFHDRSYYDAKKQGGTLRQYDSAPLTLSPFLTSMASSADAWTLMQDSLCDHHPKHPDLWSQCLATSVIISEDYTVFTFKIRKGVYWHRPAIAAQAEYAWLNKDVELTAHDFVFATELIRDPVVECQAYKSYYESLGTCEALDDYTLRLTWVKKDYENLDASLGLSPMPRHIYKCESNGEATEKEDIGISYNNKHWFNEAKQYVGVGKYTLEEWKPDEQIVFKANANYWGAPYHFDKIIWEGVTKLPDAQLAGFRNGQAHFIGLAPIQYKAEILDGGESRFSPLDENDPTAGRKGEFAWERVLARSYRLVGWNQKHPILKDKMVRRAMAYAFPKQRVIDEVFVGLGRDISANVHPDSPYFNAKVQAIPYDLEKAASILSEQGWADTDNDGWLDKEINGSKTALRISISYYGQSPTWQSMIALYKDSLKKIHVDLVATPIDENEWQRQFQEKDFGGFVMGWRMGMEVDFMNLWHSKYATIPDSQNFIGFEVKRADELAEQLRLEFDRNKRIEIAHEFQELIFDEQPYLFISAGVGIFCWQNFDPSGKRESLGGVTTGLDQFNKLYNRDNIPWYIAAPE